MAASLERNVRLYPWYSAFFSAYFWLPVFFLYFNERFSLDRVLRLEAIYFFAVVLVEVPSGYFSDVVGRRITLLTACASAAIAYVLFFFGDTYSAFVLGEVFLAVGIAFNSGTNTSMHFDSLKALGRSDEFAGREAKAGRNIFAATALASLAGGLAGSVDLRLAYGLSFLATLAAFVLVLMMHEPDRAGRGDVTLRGFFKQVGSCFGYLRNPVIRWLSAYVVILLVFNHVPYEFYQPYMRILAEEMGAEVGLAPISSGIATFLIMLFASWTAAYSIRVRDWAGLRATLLAAPLLQVAVISAMAFFLHPAVVLLILLRSCPRALLTAPRNAALAPLIAAGQRATFFSLESLAGRSAFAGTLALLSLAAAGDLASDAEYLRRTLMACVVFAVLGFVLLLFTSSKLDASPGEEGGG